MRRRVFVAALALPLIELSLRDEAQSQPSLTVIGPTNDGFKPVYYANRAGLFHKYGVAVEVATIGNGTAAAAALIGGSADIAFTNITAVLVAHSRGLPIQILAPSVMYNSANGTTAMLVAQDSPISTARDLNGKTLGSLTLGDNTYAAILAWIDQHGGDSRSVKVIEVPQSLAAHALEDGRVSAVVLNEPVVSQAIATGKVRLLAHPQDAIAPRFESAVYAVMAPAAEKNADAMSRFARAIHESALYTSTHLPETVDLVASYSGVAADVLAHSVRMTDPEYIEPQYVQPVIDVLVKYGIIQRPFPAREVISALALPARHAYLPSRHMVIKMQRSAFMRSGHTVMAASAVPLRARADAVAFTPDPVLGRNVMRRSVAVAGTLALAFVVGAAPRAAVPQTALTTIRVASTPIDVGAQVYYAQALGLFKQAGLDVHVQPVDNGAAIAAAVAGGAADIGQSNVVSLATAHEKQLPFVVIAPAGTYTSSSPTTVLVTLANAPFADAKDLEGKTLVTNGILNIAQIGGDAWLDKNGGAYKTVRWIEVPVNATAAALLNHRVDAAMMSEPSLSAALASGSFRVMAKPYDAIGARWQIGAWFATRSWVAEHPDAAKKFVAVMQQTARWANAHQDESLKMLGDVSKADYPKTMHRSVYAEKIDPTLFQPVIDNAAKYGAIAAPFPAAELFEAR